MSQESTVDTQEQSKAYIIHKLMAVILDILIVVAFVAIGSREHGIEYTFGYGVLTGLPFIDMRSIKGAFISSLISVPIALAIRVSLPQLAGREEFEFKPVFAIVSLVFLTFGWVAWRFLLGKMRSKSSKYENKEQLR